MLLRSLSCTVLLFSLVFSADAQPKPKWTPSQHIAATEPLRPEAQLKKMKVPAGFEIQLVAADPDIRKPINIAFDAQGRLWVTETIEYPYPAKPGQGRDAVKILEDFGPDGRARKITTFADKLNIPIGVLPTSTGALVYSIPSIYNLVDTKGQGQADRREVLFTGFGFEDTHGMTGEFQPGFDGWIYGCHGFRNTSTVKNARGEPFFTMASGNTYRMKPDGSRIEQFTTGQVNPFGMTIDPLGNIYTADCHSRPLTMLLRGAWYESFARPHDGLGFAPHMNTFKNHSTALCGVSYYAANQFPKEYHGKLFLGDVVLNRLNAYRLDWTGASPSAVMEDFITSSDPWFRPVDIKLGPDGCLYVADFYNRVIGHYEVPLDHPARDRDKGRIWRIVYRGPDGSGQPQPVTNLARADVKALVHALGHANLVVRMHAADQLVERGGNEAVQAIEPLLKNVHEMGSGAQKAHALWVLERLGKLDDAVLAQASSSKEKEVRVHALRILAEKKEWTPKYAALAKLALLDADATVKRVAVEALGTHPATADLSELAALVQLRLSVNPADTHLSYAVRLALRQQLRDDDLWPALETLPMNDPQRLTIADAALGVRNGPSAQFLRAQLPRLKAPVERTRDFVHYAVRYSKEPSVAWGVDFAGSRYPKDFAAQGALLKAILQANQERGGKVGDAERARCEPTVLALLESPSVNDKQVGAELAGALKLVKAQPHLLAMVGQAKLAEPLRKACVTTLIALDAKQAIGPLSQVLLREKEAIPVREQIASALAATNHPDAHAALVQALQYAPARLQTTIAVGMAGNAQGGDRLLQAIETGKASRRLLQDQAVVARLQGAKIARVKDRLRSLAQGLPPADQKAQDLIAKRRDSFTSAWADPALGQAIFQKQCASCHQINSQGAKIGPQLDGIGVRGLERLLEDVLDPNRNVDEAFRTTFITTKNGQTISGLYLREEGQLLVLADTQGKEVRVDKKLIDERSLSPLSPMPGNIAELISEPEFHHLMAYLLSQRGKS